MRSAVEVPDQVRDCVHVPLTLPREGLGVAFYTYILSCQSNTAIYIGVAGDLGARVSQHKLGTGSVHTARYRIRKLVYFEAHETLPEAIERERKLKRWRRPWKEALIEAANPGWRDLTKDASFL